MAIARPVVARASPTMQRRFSGGSRKCFITGMSPLLWTLVVIIGKHVGLIRCRFGCRRGAVVIVGIEKDEEKEKETREGEGNAQTMVCQAIKHNTTR